MTGKTTITKIILPLFCIAFLAVAFWYSQENRSADGQSPKILNSPKIAQAQVGISSIICDEPIPMGSAMEETVGIMDDVFQVYQYNYLNLAIEHIRGIVTALSENPTVCDFSKCSPYVKNRGPGLGLAVKTYGLEALWGDDSGSIKYSLRIPPLCDAEECLGQACPDISQHLVDNQSIMGLKTLQKTFETSGTIIRQIFDEKSQTVTEDFNLTGQELPSTKITRPELALRKIELSDEWLSPAVGPIQSCSLTASQRDQAAKGLFTERYPMRCQDALNQMVYWPKESLVLLTLLLIIGKKLIINRGHGRKRVIIWPLSTKNQTIGAI